MISPTRFPCLATALVVSLMACKEKEPTAAATPTAVAEPGAAAGSPTEGAPKQLAAEILATVPSGHGLHYFATRAGNHPTIYLDRGANELVVVARESSHGRGTALEKRFPANNVDDALAAYTERLLALGYKPAGAPKPKPRDLNELVAMPTQDLTGGSPDASGRFTKAQSETLYHTAPSKGWKTLSGFAHPTNDAPLIAAGGPGAFVLAPGVSEKHDWKESAAAFKAFRTAVAKKARNPAGK